MDQHHFTVWARSVSSVPSRRDVLRSLAGAGLGFGALRLSETEAAKTKKKKGKKRKRKKKSQIPLTPPPFTLPPLAFNQFGCVEVGQPCRGDSTSCCSGICEGAAPAAGQPDASRCVAHNASICKASSDLCSTGIQPVCNADKPHRTCMLTTGNAGFCADFTPSVEAGASASFYCRDCSRDTDCQAEFGPGAACVVYGGICSEYCPATGGTACMPAGA